MEPLFYAFFFLLVLLIAVLYMIKEDKTLTPVVVERPAGYLFENQFEMITPAYFKKKDFSKVKQFDASGNVLL